MPVEVKDQFYAKLDSVVKCIPLYEHIYLLGDFNVRMGADQVYLPNVLGYNVIGKMNENRQRLLEFYCYHKLYVTNTYFQNRTYHKASWRHPRSNPQHQLDLVITSCNFLNYVCNTRAYHNTVCDTDISLIFLVVKLKLQNLYYSKKKSQLRINSHKTTYPDKKQSS